MKKIFKLIFTFLAIFLLFSCSENYVKFSEEDFSKEYLNGFWHLTSKITKFGKETVQEDTIIINTKNNSIKTKNDSKTVPLNKFFTDSETFLIGINSLTEILGGTYSGDDSFMISENHKKIKREFKISNPKKNEDFIKFLILLEKQ